MTSKSNNFDFARWNFVSSKAKEGVDVLQAANGTLMAVKPSTCWILRQLLDSSLPLSNSSLSSLNINCRRALSSSQI